MLKTVWKITRVILAVGLLSFGSFVLWATIEYDPSKPRPSACEVYAQQATDTFNNGAAQRFMGFQILDINSKEVASVQMPGEIIGCHGTALLNNGTHQDVWFRVEPFPNKPGRVLIYIKLGEGGRSLMKENI